MSCFIKKYGPSIFISMNLLIAGPSYGARAVVYKEARPKQELKKAAEVKTAPKKIPAKISVKPDITTQKKDKELQKKGTAKDDDKEKKYYYNPHGKIDPFAPFIIKDQASLNEYRQGALRGEKSRQLAQMESILRKLREPKTELQRIQLSKLTLTAVIRGAHKNWAMVSDQKGRGYRLEKGTFIGQKGGVVDKIICEEKDTAFGKQSIRKVTVKEPFIKGEKIDYRFIDIEMPNRVSSYK